MSNPTSQSNPASKVVRYIVSIPGQSQPASYNVALGMKNAQLYADLTAKTYHGAIYSENADGREELVGSYIRTYPARPHQPRDAEGAPV